LTFCWRFSSASIESSKWSLEVTMITFEKLVHYLSILIKNEVF